MALTEDNVFKIQQAIRVDVDLVDDGFFNGLTSKDFKTMLTTLQNGDLPNATDLKGAAHAGLGGHAEHPLLRFSTAMSMYAKPTELYDVGEGQKEDAQMVIRIELFKILQAHINSTSGLSELKATCDDVGQTLITEAQKIRLPETAWRDFAASFAANHSGKVHSGARFVLHGAAYLLLLLVVTSQLLPTRKEEDGKSLIDLILANRKLVLSLTGGVSITGVIAGFCRQFFAHHPPPEPATHPVAPYLAAELSTEKKSEPLDGKPPLKSPQH